MLNKKNIYKDLNHGGFSKIKLFNKSDIKSFKKQIIKNLNSKKFIEQKLNVNNLQKYHRIVENENIHKKFTDPKNRYLKFEQKIISKIRNNKEIKYLLKETWGNDNFDIKLYQKKNIKKNFASFRLARPYKNFRDDVGGAHIDLHFNNKIHKNHKILYTIWVPIIGNGKNSTLRLAPGSHKKKHNVKNLTNQNKYVSKIFKENYVKKFKFERYNVKPGEVLIFHPNLLHGGSKNLTNNTRVSFDFRIFNKKYIN